MCFCSYFSQTVHILAKYTRRCSSCHIFDNIACAYSKNMHCFPMYEYLIYSEWPWNEHIIQVQGELDALWSIKCAHLGFKSR